MIFNYIRSSTKEQNEQYQINAMIEWNKNNNIADKDSRIIIDKCTGTTMTRQGLDNILTFIREGDIVVIKAIDRLSRNYNECITIWKSITDKGADIVVLDMPLLDTRKHKDLLGNFISDLVLQILAYVGQQETDFRKKRQLDGINSMPINNEGKRVSLRTGRVMGRPSATYPPNWEKIYKMWKSKEITATKSMELLNLKRTTFYKLVKRYEGRD